MIKKLEISDRIWRAYGPRGMPLFGFWINNTRWEQVEHFLETGHWPEPEYVPGLFDSTGKMLPYHRVMYKWLENDYD